MVLNVQLYGMVCGTARVWCVQLLAYLCVPKRLGQLHTHLIGQLHTLQTVAHSKPHIVQQHTPTMHSSPQYQCAANNPGVSRAYSDVKYDTVKASDISVSRNGDPEFTSPGIMYNVDTATMPRHLYEALSVLDLSDMFRTLFDDTNPSDNILKRVEAFLSTRWTYIKGFDNGLQAIENRVAMRLGHGTSNTEGGAKVRNGSRHDK